MGNRFQFLLLFFCSLLIMTREALAQEILPSVSNQQNYLKLKEQALNHPGTVQAMKEGQPVVWKLYYLKPDGRRLIHTETIFTGDPGRNPLFILEELSGDVVPDGQSMANIQVTPTEGLPYASEINQLPLSVQNPPDIKSFEATVLPDDMVKYVYVPRKKKNLDSLYALLAKWKETPSILSEEQEIALKRNSPSVIHVINEALKTRKCPMSVTEFHDTEKYAQRLFKQKKHLHFEPRVLGTKNASSLFCGYLTDGDNGSIQGKIYAVSAKEFDTIPENGATANQVSHYYPSPDPGMYMGDDVQGGFYSYRKRVAHNYVGDQVHFEIAQGVYLALTVRDDGNRGATFIFTHDFLQIDSKITFLTPKERQRAIEKLEQKIKKVEDADNE